MACLDVNRQKEVGLMGQTIAESIWEEGRLTGRSEGELISSRRLLLKLLAERFGVVPEAVLQRIESADDVDRLEATALRVSHLATPEDL
jgi:hypothetical protein